MCFFVEYCIKYFFFIILLYKDWELILLIRIIWKYNENFIYFERINLIIIKLYNNLCFVLENLDFEGNKSIFFFFFLLSINLFIVYWLIKGY